MALCEGQADGLNSRSLEIFESLGFYEGIDKEGSRMVSAPPPCRRRGLEVDPCVCRARSTSGTLIPRLDTSPELLRCESELSFELRGGN